MAPAILPNIGSLLFQKTGFGFDAPPPTAVPGSWWEISPNIVGESRKTSALVMVFVSFLTLARVLNRIERATAKVGAAKKGDFEMPVQSQLSRTLIALAAALVMSTITVGAAVGPAQANAHRVNVVFNA